MTLEKPRRHNIIRLQFSSRVISACNKLPPNVVEANTMTKFKQPLEEIWPSLFSDSV